MAIQPINVNRDDLAKFIKDPRTIRAFENLNVNQGEIEARLSDVQSAPLVGITLTDVFSNDRFLDNSANITVSDGGPKEGVSFDLTNLGAAGSYGSATQAVRITVDAKGRVTGILQFTLNTDNVTEGVTNLYFTTARARGVLSGGVGIDYDSATGEIALDAIPAPDGTYINPTSITIENGIITAIS